MIRRKEEYKLEKRVIGGGIGELELHHKFNQEEMFGKCRLCAEITLEPGQTIGEHPHEIEFEFYYLLSGELTSVGEDKSETPFRQGDMMLTGGGARHAVRNDSNAPAIMLAIVVN